MKAFLSVLLFLRATNAFAQYPFEKFTSIKYKEYKSWKLDTAASITGNNLTFYIVVPHFFGQESLTLRAVTYDSPASSFIRLYKGKKFIQKLKYQRMFNPHDFNEPLRVADINGDSLKDLKFVVPMYGCGLAAMNVTVMYLFQSKGCRFTKIEYMDKMDGNSPERDMNGDGNYEIITMDLKAHETHNYWTFNVYNFKDKSLINVNNQFNYPIMVQYLYHSNYIPAKFNLSTRNKFSLKKPLEYDIRQ